MDILVRPQELNDYDPPVKSKLMRQTSASHRVRLIDYKSLKEYLNSLRTAASAGSRGRHTKQEGRRTMNQPCDCFICRAYNRALGPPDEENAALPQTAPNQKGKRRQADPKALPGSWQLPEWEEAEPSVVIFGHLHRARRVLVCRTVREARAAWENLPKPTSDAVVALPNPDDINGLIIRK
jgi:hypothetical protein